MTDKFDEASFFRDKIIESGFTDSQLKNEVKLVKLELKNKLGKFGKIDDASIYRKIAQEHGIVLLTSSSTEPTQKSAFETYLDIRDNSRKTSLYVYNNLRPKIESLLLEIKNMDERIYDQLNSDAFDYLDVILVPSILPEDERWVRPRDFRELRREDIGRSSDAPEMFRIFFNKVCRIFLKTASDDEIEETRGIYSQLESFFKQCALIRYSNPSKPNPYWNDELASRYGNRYDWTKNYQIYNEFLKCYSGTISLVDSMRNFHTHRDDTLTYNRFMRARREIKDPLSGIDSSINFITISNLIINSIYLFIEMMQIWIDSKIIANLP